MAGRFSCSGVPCVLSFRCAWTDFEPRNVVLCCCLLCVQEKIRMARGSCAGFTYLQTAIHDRGFYYFVSCASVEEYRGNSSWIVATDRVVLVLLWDSRDACLFHNPMAATKNNWSP